MIEKFINTHFAELITGLLLIQVIVYCQSWKKTKEKYKDLKQ